MKKISSAQRTLLVEAVQKNGMNALNAYPKPSDRSVRALEEAGFIEAYWIGGHWTSFAPTKLGRECVAADVAETEKRERVRIAKSLAESDAPYLAPGQVPEASPCLCGEYLPWREIRYGSAVAHLCSCGRKYTFDRTADKLFRVEE